MSQQIKTGDLVVVVHASCQHEEPYLGRVFAVPGMRFDWSYCVECGHENDEQWHAVYSDGCGFPVSHLKRIPPLEELEREKLHRELIQSL